MAKTDVPIDFVVDTTPDKEGTELTVVEGGAVKDGSDITGISETLQIKNGTILAEVADATVIKNGTLLTEISTQIASKDSIFIMP
jgi:hypothetical protein